MDKQEEYLVHHETNGDTVYFRKKGNPAISDEYDHNGTPIDLPVESELEECKRFDRDGNIIYDKDMDNIERIYDYNAIGMVTRIKTIGPSDGDVMEENLKYNINNNVIRYKNSQGICINNIYDMHDNICSIGIYNENEKDNHIIRIIREGVGNSIKFINRKGDVAFKIHDNPNNIQPITDLEPSNDKNTVVNYNEEYEIDVLLGRYIVRKIKTLNAVNSINSIDPIVFFNVLEQRIIIDNFDKMANIEHCEITNANIIEYSNTNGAMGRYVYKPSDNKLIYVNIHLPSPHFRSIVNFDKLGKIIKWTLEDKEERCIDNIDIMDIIKYNIMMTSKIQEG